MRYTAVVVLSAPVALPMGLRARRVLPYSGGYLFNAPLWGLVRELARPALG